MPTLSVALVQLDLVDGEPARNLVRAIALIRSAPAAHLYLLPELWTTGYAHGTWAATADQTTPGIAEELGRLGRALGAWIGGSMVSRDDEGRLVNRFWLFGPNGSPPITYDKAHLFEPMLEHRYLAPGCRRVRTTVGPFTASLTICFDLRFPEQYRLDATQGADLYLCVAEWPAERAEAMRLFARARAAENQAYLALCNRVGVARDGTRFGGASLVVAPDGSVVAEGGHSEEIVRAELDRAEITALRGRLKVLGARRANVDYDRPPEP